jgi:hypothetical protein
MEVNSHIDVLTTLFLGKDSSVHITRLVKDKSKGKAKGKVVPKHHAM